MIDRFSKCFFEPWIGREFDQGIRGHRVLLLGESHYGDHIAADHRSYTADIVKRYAIDGPTIAYFTIVYRLLTNDAIPTPSLRAEFWNSVSFYNYVQNYVGTGPRQRPTTANWASGRLPFVQVIDALRPACVVVLGRNLMRCLQQQHTLTPTATTDIFYYTTDNGLTTLLATVRHPSGGFAYSRWRPTVEFMFNDGLAVHPADPANGPRAARSARC